jgi:branched-chain amino acid transport system ATP-binding protein
MDVVFRLAGRITVIYYGKVLASGAPEEIRNDIRVKDAYLGRERT